MTMECTTGSGIANQENDKHNLNIDEFGIDYKIEPPPDVCQNVDWLENNTELVLTLETLQNWIMKGPPLQSILDEHNFCDKQLLTDILNAKEVFDEFKAIDLHKARARANPFETLKSMFFMNRAALKIANIDAATDFMLTNIDRDPNHKKSCGPYYFADVCAGPGGFTEYILWRKRWSYKGFGFTLKSSNDFHLFNSTCCSSATFQAFYGSQKDGNVFCPDNISDFAKKVLHETEQLGVHFMMSDGGFSVEGNEELQEVLSKQIYACQCLVALEIVREKGYFVTKVFDLFTKFSVGLVYLMRKCFDKVGIIKPIASRPANSERYLICYGLRKHSEMITIRKHLRYVVNELWNLRQLNSCLETDIIEIVPLEVLKSDLNFFNYIYNSNNRIGQNQLKALVKLRNFCENPSLIESRQREFRSQALIHWRIPDKPKESFFPSQLENVLNAAVKDTEFLAADSKEINDLSQIETSNLKYLRFCWLNNHPNSNNCTFFAGVAHTKAFQYDKYTQTWFRTKSLHLFPGTLLYGELANETDISKNEDNTETDKLSLHVIDAIKLGDISLMDFTFNERLNLIKTFCEALNHETRNSIRIRYKQSKPLIALSSEELICNENIFCDLRVLGIDNLREIFKVNGVLLIKTDFCQTFRTSFVTRKFVCFNENVNFNEFCKFVTNMLCNS